MGVNITINGETLFLPLRCSVRSLLDTMVCGGRVAVEVNGEIVPRSQYSTRTLTEGDQVEIVRAIGGG